MRRGSTGRYQMTSVAGEVVRAFIPSPLPPQPPLDLDASCQQLLERATLGIVQEITGRQRNRAFAYQNYLKILSEGTEAP